MPKWIQMACALSLILIPLTASAGPAPSTPKLGAEAKSLLGDRLQMRIPPGMRVEARRSSIMAAAAANENESRFALDQGKERLVLMAYELFSTAGPDFAAAVQADVKTGWGPLAPKCKLAPLKVAKPLLAMANTPPAPNGKRQANLFYGVYVKTADGMVQFLAFYANPEALPHLAAYRDLAQRMAASLKAGKRKLNLGAGPRRLSGLGAGDLTIALPEGTSLVSQPGPDFVVHHLRPVTVLGQEASSCGVYLGHHPSYQHRQTRDLKDKVEEKAGEMLGKACKWQAWDRKGGRKMLEVIVPHPAGQGLLIHAFCNATDDQAMAPLKTMLESLKAVQP